MPRLLLILLALLLAAPAAAQAQEIVPTDGLTAVAPATLPRDGATTVRVGFDRAAQSVEIRVAAADDTDAYDRLSKTVVQTIDATPDGAEWAAAIGGEASFSQRPGPYWWQAIATVVTPEGVPITYVGPVQEVAVTAPAADTARKLLHGRFGSRGHASFRISTFGLPPGVGAKRFVALTRQSAKRWGLRVAGVTSAPATRGDGRNTVGFGDRVPAEALAFQRDLFYGSRLYEQDIVIRDDLDWQAGPGYPAVDEYDLESVLIHELGHLAGNKRHRSICANHPLAAALGDGEWWRGRRDAWRFSCARVASASKAAWPGSPTFLAL